MRSLLVLAVVLIAAFGLTVALGGWEIFQKQPPGNITPEQMLNVQRQPAAPVSFANPESRLTAQQQPERDPDPGPEPAAKLDVQMTLFVAAESATRVHVEGKTTLPPGTVLQVAIQPNVMSAAGTVQDDQTFAAGSGVIKAAGKYEVSVRAEPGDQPSSVRALIGGRGEMLTGPLAGSEGFAAKGTFEVTAKPWRRLPIVLE